MTISAVWTDPASLDRTALQTVGQATWENAIGNELYLYDLLNGVDQAHPLSLAQGQLLLTNPISNRIDFGVVGVDTAPGAAGVKLILYNRGSGSANSAIGVSGTAQWYNVPTGAIHEFDVNGSRAAAINGAGNILAGNAVFASNGIYQCVESQNMNRNHLEYMTDSASTNVASGGVINKTLVFTRAYAFVPALASECSIGGAIPNKTSEVSAVSTSSATITFTNHDPGTQPMSNFSIISYGA